MPRQPQRPAQPNIPNAKSERERLRQAARDYAARVRLVPPLTLDELREHAQQLCDETSGSTAYHDWLAILLNNEAWRDVVARIPYNRRLLLLPKCLRSAERCPAPVDDFGLVCQGCRQCAIHDLQAEAERLGYAVLVAEGSVVVTKMIETGQIEAVVGASCMDVLEKCFPHMEARAVPGLAIPLLQDGCADTSLDLDWLLDAVHLTSDDRSPRLDLEALKNDVQGWFAPDALEALLGPARDETEKIARAWLAQAGKRWRPMLAVCMHAALRCDAGQTPVCPDDLKRVAVAVECFHKASLAHDDIEDGDELRYGQRALHAEYGVPVALNVGDFLLGEGYRLIGELDVDDHVKAAMLQAAAHGHLTLSRGQGAELCWARQPRPLSSLAVLEIFRQKTAPAFEVALQLGALYAGADAHVHDVLPAYSEALGIAYQIRDDLEDFSGAGDSHDLRDLRPSLMLAVAHKRAATPAEQDMTAGLWSRTRTYEEVAEGLHRLLTERGVIETIEDLLAAYLAQATRTLPALQDATLKGLLRRIIGKIFGTGPMQGYCREHEARHAAGRARGPDSAA